MSQAPTDGGPLKTLLPVLILLALVGGAVAYFVFFSNTNATPPTPATPTTTRPTQPQVEIKIPTMDTMTGDAKTVADEVKAAVEKLPQLLGGISDAATADAALHKLAEMKAKLDGVKTLYDKLEFLPKITVSEFVRGKLGGLKPLVTKTLALPGLEEKLKPVQATFDSLEGFSK